MKGYYKKRWEQFFDFLLQQPDHGNRYSEKGLKKVYDRPAYDANDFYKLLAVWENNWLNDRTVFPSTPVGDPVSIAARLLAKWSSKASLLL